MESPAARLPVEGSAPRRVAATRLACEPAPRWAGSIAGRRPVYFCAFGDRKLPRYGSNMRQTTPWERAGRGCCYSVGRKRFELLTPRPSGCTEELALVGSHEVLGRSVLVCSFPQLASHDGGRTWAAGHDLQGGPPWGDERRRRPRGRRQDRELPERPRRGPPLAFLLASAPGEPFGRGPRTAFSLLKLRRAEEI